MDSLLKKGNDINEEDEVILTNSQNKNLITLFSDQHHRFNMGGKEQKHGYYKNVAKIRQRFVKNEPLRSHSIYRARF